MQLVREPDTETALQFLQHELLGLTQKKGRLVQIIAQCQVSYQGRARSMLHKGERILLLKPDGTFLVHASTKAKPVNWQPPGASFHAGIEDDALVLTAYRAKPEEIVKVTFSEIHLLLATPLHDEEALALVGSEDDLQQLLFERPELVEEGFVPRRRERDSKRGFYDLDGDDADGRRLVIEVKRSTAGIKEAQQLWRYVEALRTGDGSVAQGDEDQVQEAATVTVERVRGMLIAPRVADKARKYLGEHELEWKELAWDQVLPEVERMRRVGQVGLGRFGRD